MYQVSVFLPDKDYDEFGTILYQDSEGNGAVELPMKRNSALIYGLHHDSMAWHKAENVLEKVCLLDIGPSNLSNKYLNKQATMGRSIVLGPNHRTEAYGLHCLLER